MTSKIAPPSFGGSGKRKKPRRGWASAELFTGCLQCPIWLPLSAGPPGSGLRQRYSACDCRHRRLVLQVDFPLAHSISVSTLLDITVDVISWYPSDPGPSTVQKRAHTLLFQLSRNCCETFRSVGSIVLPLTSVMEPTSSALPFPCSLVIPPKILLRPRQW